VEYDGVAVTLEFITSSVIQNCFTECSFGIQDAVGTEEDNQDSSDWVELQSHVDYPSIFDDFLNVDQFIQTTEDLCEISSSHGDKYEVQNCLLGCTAV
jgi:hypothetical protein